MDQGTLVEEQIADGRRFVERFAADGNPVDAAFWVQTSDDGIWFLYVTTKIYDSGGPAASYRAVDASLQRLGKSSLTGSEIKIISPNNPIAKDALTIMHQRPMPMATGSTTLGGISVDKVLLYPPRLFTLTHTTPMTTEEVGREILRLMNRGPGILQTSRVALKDGTGFDGVPFSLELGTQSAIVVRFLADREVAPRLVRLDEIASVT